MQRAETARSREDGALFGGAEREIGNGLTEETEVLTWEPTGLGERGRREA
jgi:hypothetical protein